MSSGPAFPWSVVDPLLDELLELDAAGSRRRLRELAQSDPALADHLAALLEAARDDRSVVDLDASSLMALARPAEVEAEPGAPGTTDPERPVWPRVPGFVLAERIASGAMAEVFRATPEGGGDAVAVKLLRPELGKGALARRFDVEQRILRELAHPGIVRYLAAGVTPEGRAWLATEWVDGEELGAWMAARAGDVPAQVERIAEVAEALAWAHARGVVHRDVKPSNIRVGRDGRTRLLDFGLAGLLVQGDGRRSSSSDLWVFTLDYAAPEQLRGREVGSGADVYGLGLLLFEAGRGEPLWRRSSRPLALVLTEVASERPPAGLLVDRRLDRLARRCLRSDPGRRPSAAEVATELRAWLATRPQSPARRWWSKKSVMRR